MPDDIKLKRHMVNLCGGSGQERHLPIFEKKCDVQILFYPEVVHKRTNLLYKTSRGRSLKPPWWFNHNIIVDWRCCKMLGYIARKRQS